MHGGSSRSQDIKERNGKVELWSGKRDARRGIQGEDDWRLNHVKTPFLSRMCSETNPLDLIPNELLVTCIPSTQLAIIPWLWFLYWAIICWASHVPTIGLGEVMKGSLTYAVPFQHMPSKVLIVKHLLYCHQGALGYKPWAQRFRACMQSPCSN